MQVNGADFDPFLLRRNTCQTHEYTTKRFSYLTFKVIMRAAGISQFMSKNTLVPVLLPYTPSRLM
jgi:hypothetical protein